jgi:site-specific DNA-methyltransferase (cytosine-N4-specific)
MIGKWDATFLRQINKNGIEFDEESPMSFYYSQLEILNKTWVECMRVLIPGGIMVINIGDATRSIEEEFCCWPNYAHIVASCHSLGFTPLIPIYWKKISNKPNAFLGSGFYPVNAYVRQDCEYFAIFRKGASRKFNREEQVRRRNSAFTKEERDTWFNQVWDGIPGKRGAKQTSGWNPEIPYRLVRMFSIEGDTILDPFCGLVGGQEFEKLCAKLKRNFIGYTLPLKMGDPWSDKAIQNIEGKKNWEYTPSVRKLKFLDEGIRLEERKLRVIEKKKKLEEEKLKRTNGLS